MKKSFLPLLGGLFLLAACTQKPDSLIGTWTVDKVNVQFDENRTTPELVKQIGEMEKENRIHISSDSILVFTTLDNETQGRMTVDQQSVIYCDGERFGLWKDGTIVTTVSSPLGEITVKYQKK
jgi:hypothetical protein